jgi:hypothetical protein
MPWWVVVGDLVYAGLTLANKVGAGGRRDRTRGQVLRSLVRVDARRALILAVGARWSWPSGIKADFPRKRQTR